MCTLFLLARHARTHARRHVGRLSQRKRTVPLSYSTRTGNSAVQYKLKFIHLVVECKQ